MQSSPTQVAIEIIRKIYHDGAYVPSAQHWLQACLFRVPPLHPRRICADWALLAVAPSLSAIRAAVCSAHTETLTGLVSRAPLKFKLARSFRLDLALCPRF